MQSRGSYKKAIAAYASRERNWKDLKKTKSYQKKVDRDSKGPEGTSDEGKNGKNKKCRFCGRIHRPKMCPAYGQECRKCKKKKHWASCCQSKTVNETKQNVIETITEDNAANINACKATTIINTRAEVNVMPKRVYYQLQKSNKKITKMSVKLHGYGGHDILVIGTIRLECSINDIPISTDFSVAQTKSKTILGLKSSRDMMLVKIIDKLNEKSAEKNTDEGNQKNIIKENVKRISGKKGDDLKQQILG